MRLTGSHTSIRGWGRGSLIVTALACVLGFTAPAAHAEVAVRPKQENPPTTTSQPPTTAQASGGRAAPGPVVPGMGKPVIGPSWTAVYFTRGYTKGTLAPRAAKGPTSVSLLLTAACSPGGAIAGAVCAAIGYVGGAWHFSAIEEAAAQNKCAALTLYHPPFYPVPYAAWSVEDGPHCLP